MTNKIIAYNYKPWKEGQIAGIIANILLLVSAGNIILEPEPSTSGIVIAILAFLLFGTSLFVLSYSLFKSGLKKQLPYNSYYLKLYRKYNPFWFVIICGTPIALVVEFISILISTKYKGVEHLNEGWMMYVAIFFLLMLLAGTYQLIKLKHILKAGEPVYDIYSEAKAENHENIK